VRRQTESTAKSALKVHQKHIKSTAKVHETVQEADREGTVKAQQEKL